MTEYIETVMPQGGHCLAKRLLVLLTVLMLSCASAPRHAQDVKVKNVIYLIGDGMGVSQITLAKVVHGKLVLDEFPVVGLVTTHSADQTVTDSAAAATALATGKKTNNFVIGIPNTETLLTLAQKRGKATGLVTTARVTHATPAPFAALAEKRSQEQEIANQYPAANVDVLLGGGAKFFGPDLLKKFERYEIVRTGDELAKAKGPKLLGLFHEDHIPYVLDRRGEPSLADMTRKALEVLSQDPDGFFVMIEGARIDMACHASDAPSCVHEMVDFDAAVRVAVEFAKKHGDTLVVVTADHATGGLAITEKLHVRKEHFAKVKVSAEWLARKLRKEGGDVKKALADHMGVTDVTAEELAAYEKAEGPYDPATRLGEIVSRRCGVTFIAFEYRILKPNETHGHDAAMVPCYAWGPGQERFAGTYDNTDLPTRIRALAGY